MGGDHGVRGSGAFPLCFESPILRDGLILRRARKRASKDEASSG